MASRAPALVLGSGVGLVLDEGPGHVEGGARDVALPDRILYMYLLFPLPAKSFVMIIGGIVFLTALASSNSGVSNAAHLGGMWADLVARAEADLAACAPSQSSNHDIE